MSSKNSGPNFIIKKCDTSSPYVFISYSSTDKKTVHEDVAEFQRRGYNVWVDTANLDLTKDSWRDDVYPAVASENCKKVLFSKMMEAAKEEGFDVLAEGSNMDDLSEPLI